MYEPWLSQPSLCQVSGFFEPPPLLAVFVSWEGGYLLSFVGRIRFAFICGCCGRGQGRCSMSSQVGASVTEQMCMMHMYNIYMYQRKCMYMCTCQSRRCIMSLTTGDDATAHVCLNIVDIEIYVYIYTYICMNRHLCLCAHVLREGVRQRETARDRERG